MSTAPFPVTRDSLSCLRHIQPFPLGSNCLFRALGDQLEGHSRNHLRHRQETVEFMVRQRGDFEPFVEDDVPFDKHGTGSLGRPGRHRCAVGLHPLRAAPY